MKTTKSEWSFNEGDRVNLREDERLSRYIQWGIDDGRYPPLPWTVARVFEVSSSMQKDTSHPQAVDFTWHKSTTYGRFSGVFFQQAKENNDALPPV